MTAPRGASLDEVVVAAEPEPWAEAGFAVEGDVVRVGATRVRLAGARAGRGILEWSLRGIVARDGGGTSDLDGLPTRLSEAAPPEPGHHRNGAVRVDHVVALTTSLDRTVAALEDGGLDLRRVRDAVLPGGGTRQAFFRLGEVVLEAIEQPGPDGSAMDPSKPARLWGLAFLTTDLDATAAAMADRLGAPREAIQPGRRIATVPRDAGLGTAVAFITPAPSD